VARATACRRRLALWYWIAPLALLASRILWQRRPGFAACALFWGLAVVVLLLEWPSGLAQYTFGLGVACNASVTLINGGYMPVATHRKLRGPARSLWVQKQSGQRLGFLADNFGNRFVRFSIGDVFMLAGIALSFAGL
jgi:hypothetical protein